MSFTLRENRTLSTLVAVWVLGTALATLAGPFGTLDALPLMSRFAYWACVVALSVFGNQVVSVLSQGRSNRFKYLMWIGFIIVTTSVIYLLNSHLFENWYGLAKYFYLFGVVTAIVLIVHGAFALIHSLRPEAAASSPENPSATFLLRIPLAQRGALIRIEAQDHYLNVITTKGSSLILLRLGEAVQELDQAQGMQVHRSHWVALSAVKKYHRKDGRDLLLMADGQDVPISRSFRDAARAAGLF